MGASEVWVQKPSSLSTAWRLAALDAKSHVFSVVKAAFRERVLGAMKEAFLYNFKKLVAPLLAA